MYIKAVYALLQLPENEGNLTQISDLIAQHSEFSKDLDWTPRPGAKTYPRYDFWLVLHVGGELLIIIIVVIIIIVIIITTTTISSSQQMERCLVELLQGGSLPLFAENQSQGWWQYSVSTQHQRATPGRPWQAFVFIGDASGHA